MDMEPNGLRLPLTYPQCGPCWNEKGEEKKNTHNRLTNQNRATVLAGQDLTVVNVKEKTDMGTWRPNNPDRKNKIIRQGIPKNSQRKEP